MKPAYNQLHIVNIRMIIKLQSAVNIGLDVDVKNRKKARVVCSFDYLDTVALEYSVFCKFTSIIKAVNQPDFNFAVNY